MITDKDCILDYIDKQPLEIQSRLMQIRDVLKRTLPEAEERISWQMPTFWQGRNIIHFAAFKKHIGIYPGPDAIVHFSQALEPFKTSKGAIQIPHDVPIPLDLISEIAVWCFETGSHH